MTNAEVELRHLSTATSVQQMCCWSLSVRPIVKHYPCSEWSWCYVKDRRQKKQNIKKYMNAIFSFFKALCRECSLWLELNSTWQAQFWVVFQALRFLGKMKRCLSWRLKLNSRSDTLSSSPTGNKSKVLGLALLFWVTSPKLRTLWP